MWKGRITKKASTPSILGRGCESKIFKDKFPSILDSLSRGCPFLLFIFTSCLRDTLSRMALNQSSPSFRTSKCWIYNHMFRNPWTVKLRKDTSILNNWKASASQNQASPAVKSGIVFTCGGWNCLHSGWQQQACWGTGTRQWGDYAISKVCASDFLIIATYLFGPAGNQGWLQVNVTQINEGWRRWGQTSGMSQQKQGVSHAVKPSWKLHGKCQRLKGAFRAGGPRQEEIPQVIPLADFFCETVIFAKRTFKKVFNHLFMLYWA